tara:strand:- start:83 stop:388 length:306 start_codon:yes stop_codon:yes gene_type:complete
MVGDIVVGLRGPKTSSPFLKCWSLQEIEYLLMLENPGVLGFEHREGTLNLGWRDHWRVRDSDWTRLSTHQDGSIEKWVVIGRRSSNRWNNVESLNDLGSPQ